MILNSNLIINKKKKKKFVDHKEFELCKCTINLKYAAHKKFELCRLFKQFEYCNHTNSNYLLGILHKIIYFSNFVNKNNKHNIKFLIYK